MTVFFQGAVMIGSSKRVLENFKALEPAQQERVKQAMVEALEVRALVRAHVILNRSEAPLAGKGSDGDRYEDH